MSDNGIPNETLQKLESFCKINTDFSRFWTSTNLDIRTVYKHLGRLLLHSRYTVDVVLHFREEFLDIISCSFPDNVRDQEDHVQICVAFGKILELHPDAKSFVIKYFEKHPAPFEWNVRRHPVKKKLNYEKVQYITKDLEIVSCCYSFLRHCAGFFKNIWSWSTFIERYLNNESNMVRWLCLCCIKVVTGMNEFQFYQLTTKYLNEDSIRKCQVEWECAKLKMDKYIHQHTLSTGSNKDAILVISNGVVCVSGVYLPVYQKIDAGNELNLVDVESTKNNLRKLALGVATNKAVCLQGPVGSGKTFLVEYLAAKTGRILGNSFVKVQLGDQTDSKMLLGTYRCTDIPGEFLWQPGVLTQAVMDGSWLLLEDIDLANMDIASVLTALFENNSLTVPGYRDSVAISPGFKLFMTQRLILTLRDYHKKQTNAVALLQKNALQINIEPLSSAELHQVIQIIFPNLKTIANRMVDTFFLFFSYSITNNRLVSTRDLFKWCTRAAINFDVSSQESAINVLQNAIDVFCCSFSNLNDRLMLAREISSRLGIINEKVDFFFDKYKPNISLTSDSLKSSRVSLPREIAFTGVHVNFCFTCPSACLLERIMCCVSLKEPVLLVGETGTGKTSTVQYLAHSIGSKLVVINMNQQSDSADLLGGYKPVDLKIIIAPIRREFDEVFRTYFDVSHNKEFLDNVDYCFKEQKWELMIKLMKVSSESAIKRLCNSDKTKSHVPGTKRPIKHQKEPAVVLLKKEEGDVQFLKLWKNINAKLQKLEIQLKHKTTLAFSFIEGSLVKAVKNGNWILLDEINLANAETLECLSGLLEGSKGSVNLLERGDKQPIKRHPRFTLFACMNPSTDVGKRDLPPGLRNRFTEFFIDELVDKNDLLLLVDSYLDTLSLPRNKLESIVKFYLSIRREARVSLSDGLGHKPHFSLRTLCRALMVASKNPCGVFTRSLYEAFCVSFLTQLDTKSYEIVGALITKYILGIAKDARAILKQPIPKPKVEEFASDYLEFEGYWVPVGKLAPCACSNYVITNCVRQNLKDLVRVVSIGKTPVLLQGDTSVGKTSLIMYLAKSSGNKCVRINNHEHTDLQEYIGSYMADVNGKLVFKEGLLVEAMRKGHWIILDELNLAPTDVLEALNRVLDDNKELFIAETQKIVKAHPNFMLFATQNPPGIYGGRKMLSRAFRNRFVELHFNEIPPAELEYILHKRCEIPLSYSKKMVAVMFDLQMRRRGSAAFAGKQGFITLRDLFRWGERYHLANNRKSLYDWDQHLTDEGYLLLAGRVRKIEERNEIVKVLQKHMKCEVIPSNLFTLSAKTSTVTRYILEKLYANKYKYENIVWTYNMRQLAILVGKALEFHEPILLVGETGGGKTTICQLLAVINEQDLFTVNCHMHTESSDFIGSLRPVRDHTNDNSNRLFEWVDGPLIQAMVQGGMFLADEISLADDSVLERLNSLLESERLMLLAEKGSDLNNSKNSEVIAAHDNFQFIGTMNPGGDYGKKELSPALRNRFTEIWCESCTYRKDLIDIIEQNVKSGISLGKQDDGLSGIGSSIMDFIEWFKETEIGKRFTTSIRDILTWVNFINSCFNKIDVADAYLHGACLTFLDSFGSGITNSESYSTLQTFQEQCIKYLVAQLRKYDLESASFMAQNLKVEVTEATFDVKPFSIPLGSGMQQTNQFTFEAPTCAFNALRLLRGLQLNKAILLEGSPGVGKTSLVIALAKATRNQILRINLSDQTDISDLFGSDLPVEGGTGGQFAWRDGPFLRALKKGHWILLDELNLASQSVLEGLNACLDHRGEIFIPELGKTFSIKSGTRLFACQNPLKQGGSRRGLPQSFLNRFTQVYINPLNDVDLRRILTAQFPLLLESVVSQMIKFNARVVKELGLYNFGNKGSPWEFNLRDVTRWCEAVLSSGNKPENLFQLIYSDRMRTTADKKYVCEIFEEIFGLKIQGVAPIVYLTESVVHIGDVCLNRELCGVNMDIFKEDQGSLVLRNQIPILRSLAYCVNLNWMAILVGSSGCGKSSVVRTLASLVGKTLHTLPVTSAMDTTEILGGFEQADYTRHLEEISKQVERELLETVQECMINGDHIRGSKILRMWEKFSTIIRGEIGTQTMSEETQFFLNKLESLEEIWRYLLTCNKENSSKLHRLRLLVEKGRVLREAVRAEGNLNVGGKFEWVDSILVKCLQEGAWLLIDNVNLCSPAVLDRLNALLEPNGVLTIGERGVKNNGEIVEIKPHKDFRLFLTMDPKNGEISRAMRNRGLEIYMLNLIECVTENMYDIKSLVFETGLKINSHIEALLEIHNYISELTLGEKPNINHILQASFLIAQQVLRGRNVLFAFRHTIVDVYYKSRPASEFERDDTLDLINNKLKRILTECKREAAPYNNNVTLKTSNLSQSSTIEKIKQQSMLLQECLTNKPLLLNLLIHTYCMTTNKDVSVRYLYLKECILPIIQSLQFDEICSKLCQVIVENNSQVSDLPLDLRWLPDSTFHTNEKLNFSNKLYLLLYFIANTILNINKYDKQEKELSLLQLFYAIRSKKTEAKIDDILESNLLDLLDAFDQFLIENLQLKVLKLKDESVINILSFLRWRFVFHKLTKINIKQMNITEYRNIIENLHIHYKWFWKFSIKALGEHLNNTTDDTLLTLANKINKKSMSDFSVLKKLAKIYHKQNNKPLPLINDKQIQMYQQYQEISNAFDLCNKQNNFMQILKVLLNNPKLRLLLISTKTNLTLEFYEPSNDYLKLKELSDFYKFDEDLYSSYKPTDIEILPILDCISRLAINKLKRNLNDTGENIEMLKQSVTIPTNLLGVLEQYSVSKDVSLKHELSADLHYYLVNSASITPFRFKSLESEVVEYDAREPLAVFAPLLSYSVAQLLIPEINHKEPIRVTKFGNYRDVLNRNRLLSLLLWMNLQNVSDESYDYVFCESKYINQSYDELIIQLKQVLNITTKGLNNNELATAITEKIEQIYEDSEIDDFNGDKDLLITLWRRCTSEIAKLISYDVLIEKLHAISNLYFLLNYLKMIFNSKLPLIDPLAKTKLKKQYCLEEIDNLNCIKHSYILQNEVYSNSKETIHSRVALINAKIKALEAKEKEFGKYIAVRPKNTTYNSMSKDILHHFAIVLTPVKIVNLFERLNNHYNTIWNTIINKGTLNLPDCDKFGKEVTQHCSSYINLIEVIKKYRYTYPDIVAPLLDNLAQFLYAVQLKINIHYKLLSDYNNMNSKVDLGKDLINIIRFPTLTFEQPHFMKSISLYMDGHIQDFVKSTMGPDYNRTAFKIESFRLLKCGIYDVYNLCILDGGNCKIFDKKLFREFDNLLQIFIEAWKRQEEELELKRKEEASLYKLKSKTEENEMEEEFNRLFPNFIDQDFREFQTKALDDEFEPQQNIPTNYVGIITFDDVKFVSQIHAQLLGLYTKTEWLASPKKIIECDFVMPLLQKCKLFKVLLDKFGENVDYRVDAELLSTLNVLISVAQKFEDYTIPGEDGLNLSRYQVKKCYDFYNHPNVDQVKKSFYILEELRMKIVEFLNEWPEHPNLVTIQTIIERVYNFNITSPLSRFLTGFEILLTKCHEWEENAHAGVSLSPYIQNLVQQIISWRKIEMGMWKNSLNNAFDRMNDPIAKWWFYIYEVMLQFIQENKFGIEELVLALQKFITQSNLAEFENRLELLFTFHCHAVQLDRTNKLGIFINILWNIREYYKQFVSNIETKIKTLRTPIEKKLKEYIKIVKWKDISYWAVKQTIEKTHKTLHKYIKEFEDVLKQPASSCFTNVGSQTKDSENVGIWDRPQRQSPKTYHYTMDPATYMAKSSHFKNTQNEPSEIQRHGEKLFGRVDRYFYKARTLCKDTMFATDYPKLIQSLDGFVTNIIETSNRLQNSEVDTSLPKEKQRSHVKGILQQKRKALADLFKMLTEIGLSFRTGVFQSRTKSNYRLFLIKPIDLNAAFQHLNYCRNDEKLLTIWEGCEMYYTRALVRLDLLELKLRNPAKDLGIQNLERCKGFSEHLMSFIQEQKQKLIESSRTLYYLRFYSTCLSVTPEESYLSINTYHHVKEFLKNALIVMKQYKIILYTCPDEAIVGSEPISVLTLKPKYFSLYKESATWKDCMEIVIFSIETLQKLLNNLEKFVNILPNTEFKLADATHININNKHNVMNDLKNIAAKLKMLNENFGNVPMINSSKWVIQEIERVTTLLAEDVKTLSQASHTDVDQLRKVAKKLFDKILIVIQNIYKQHKLDASAIKNDEEEENKLKLFHLKTLIVEDLSKDIDILEMKVVLKHLHKVVTEYYRFQSDDFKAIVSSSVIPLLEQVILLYQFYVTQQVSAYRVTCKLSSILSNIFIDLANKGFCVPPEFSEELNAEGEGQQNVGGLGLGEGKGDRDVSDKIESEDQLEDAQPSGQENDQQEDKDCKEEEKGIEMSEDFEGKMQDVEKDNDEIDEKSDSDEDVDEQMGETGNDADKLDQHIWGSDDEEANDEEQHNKEEKGNKGEKDGQDKLTAKDDETYNNEDDQMTNNSKEKKEREIDKIEEPEVDDKQIDPFHGNHPEYPEPEPMDLPEDLQLDDEMQDMGENQDEENPFDIDTMKELMPQQENEGLEEQEKATESNEIENETNDTDTSDNEIDINESKNNNEEDVEPDESENLEKSADQGEPKDEAESKENLDSTLDQKQTDQDQSQAMDVDDAIATDNVQTNPTNNHKSSQSNQEINHEDNLDKDGVGQSRMEESKTGHKSQTSAQEDMSSNRQNEQNREEERKRKPGDSDSKRSLGDVTESVKKRLKTIDVPRDSEDANESEDDEEKQNAEIYRHIKEAKDSDNQVLDVATEEQVQKQKETLNLEDEKAEEAKEMSDILQESVEDDEIIEIAKQKSEKVNSETEKLNSIAQSAKGDILEEELQEIEIEGNLVKTSTVKRGSETTHHTQYSTFDVSCDRHLSIQEINQMRIEVEQQLSVWSEIPTTVEAEQAWEKISSVTSSLARGLSEQLRLVLEPTQASHLKGDYRTGRRINMRKVIPYIASEFRKDKIWLRRTKPSKREYQIALAIDDSSSMSNNHSKELAFESIALISRALTLLESGQLSILSFGETTEILHKLTDTFTRKSGSKLLQKFQFAQKKTCVAKLVDFVTEMLNSAYSQTDALIAKLLIIVSDGRGIFSEGDLQVQQSVRRAKLMNIFMVFVIVDNPESKDSILDIRMPTFKDGKLLGIKPYMDSFPFPFYIILRDINSLPNVLSDALRQWFEIVANVGKQ